MLARLVLCGGVLLVLAADAKAANSSSSSKLQWGRPQTISRATPAPGARRSINQLRSRTVIRDAQVVAAAWEDELEVQQTAVQDRSVVVERSAPVYDPFEEDDRLAQLPDDPFDEPVGESIPVPEDEPVDDLESAESALEQEIKRRQSADDIFGGEDPLETDAIEDSVDYDPLEEDPGGEDSIEQSPDVWETPDLQLDYDQEDVPLTAEELEERQRELEKERREHEEACREEFEELESDRISSIDLSISVPGNPGEDFPYECAVSTKRHEPRQWPQITYTWKAAALCHKPLYFEQVQLERYGHSWGPIAQPIMSGVHFFGTIPILPYKMGIRTPCECVYTLGYYRPGSCAPYMIDPIPFTWRAALFQGGAVTGVSFAVP